MAGFKKKENKQAYLKLAMYGPPGSGKTLTSLLMAEGLAKLSNKKVAFCDTEEGSGWYTMDIPERMVHPKGFDFDCLDTRSITEVLEEVQKLDTNEYGVLVIDSVTHLWESAKNAYDPGNGQEIPIHMWSTIKKPYKDLMQFLISANMHVIICGREGNEYESDKETGEDRVVGKKLRGEGDTAYEPHLMVRLKPRREGESFVHQAIIEKDRTGILTGKIIEWPHYDTICQPLVHLLGKEQAQIETDDQVAAKDSIKLTDMQRAKQQISAQFLNDFLAKFQLAKTKKDLENESKMLTPEIKKQMTTNDVATLRRAYSEKLGIMN